MALFLSAATLLFFVGMTEILILRFQKGDVYPAYSSYRSDPLGTKAFYQGLGLLRGVIGVRNVEPLARVSGLSGATLFLFGVQESQFHAMPQASLKALEDAALGGGRIIISLAPTHARPVRASKEKKEANEEGAKQRPEEGLLDKGTVDLAEHWGLKTKFSPEKEEEASLSAQGEDLPSSLAWYSTLYFEPRGDAWRTIYTRAGKAVLIERSHGKGSIVLSSDSFFASNEAMKRGGYFHLLSWLCGRHQKIIFDETHLGIAKSPGIANLLRGQGLTPFFISFIVLALLAIWRQSAGFVPPYEEEKATVDLGKDSSAGLANLLRRNISPEDILKACLEEWKRSFTQGGKNLSALVPRMREIMETDTAQAKKNRDPVQAYRKISALEAHR